MKQRSIIILSTVIAIIWQIITFFMDQKIFEVSPISNLPDYIICKAVALAASFCFIYMIISLILPGRKDRFSYRYLTSALIYIPVILIIAIVKIPQGYYTGDEIRIFSSAVTLTHFTWFYYLTPFFYIISFMLIPHIYAPMMVKCIIMYLVVAYVVYRTDKYFYTGKNPYLIAKPFKIRLGQSVLVLFFLWPVLAYTTSAHRLPTYFPLYLLLFTILIFDKLEKESIDLPKALGLFLLIAVLTQWRTEGIYLVVLGPLLFILTYENLNVFKKAVRLKTLPGILSVILVSLLLQGLIALPQKTGITQAGSAANSRLSPLYIYEITNMLREGLDTEKYAEELASIDKYVSIDALNELNENYGDENYSDTIILFDGQAGTRTDDSSEEYLGFSDAVKTILKENIPLFLKTRFKAFNYSAVPYKPDFTFTSAGAAFSSLKNDIKFIAYNLYIPVLIVCFFIIYTIIRKKVYSFLILCGWLAHWFIVFILAPASYFKYYFPNYILAYFMIIVFAIGLLYNRANKDKQLPIPLP